MRKAGFAALVAIILLAVLFPLWRPLIARVCGPVFARQYVDGNIRVLPRLGASFWERAALETCYQFFVPAAREEDETPF